MNFKQAIEKITEILSYHILPDSKTTDKEIVSEIIGIVDPAPTETFMDRLIAERDQLQDRHTKLEAFLSDKEKATKISGPTQVAMLIEQYQHMFKYLNILDERILDLQVKM